MLTAVKHSAAYRVAQPHLRTAAPLEIWFESESARWLSVFDASDARGERLVVFGVVARGQASEIVGTHVVSREGMTWRSVPLRLDTDEQTEDAVW